MSAFSSVAIISLLSLLFIVKSSASNDFWAWPNSKRFRILRHACLKRPPLVCVFSETENSIGKVSGTVLFQSVVNRIGRRRFRCAVKISGTVSGFSPGLHGFHIHTYGDLRSNDGTGTGGHFTNPNGDDISHGFSTSNERHWGDFGNINVTKSGEGSFEAVDSLITINGIIGRGMIIHELEDRGPDFQPTGSAGARQAQCIIGLANPSIN